MTPFNLIRNQISRISNVIYILLFLFAVNLIFNLNYQWYGISLIVKVYLFLFSFYIVYIFSLIDVSSRKSVFYELYGKKGVYILFFVTRVFPVLIIYSAIIMYTLIDDIGKSYWPVTSILNIMSGRNSNIVFLAIILMVILKWRKRPGVTIPVFLGLAVLHFIVYKSIYRYLPLGIPLTGVKVLEFIIFLFFLVYEFNAEKRKITKSIVASILAGVMLYFSFIGVYSLIYTSSRYDSYHRVTVSMILLRMGYSFPLEGLREVIVKTGRYELVDDFLFYSNKYNMDIDFSEHTWKDIFISSSMQTGEQIIQYIMKRNVDLAYQRVVSYAEIKSVDDGRSLIASENLIRYSSRYIHGNYNDFIARYKSGNRYYKIWSQRVLAGAGDIEYIPFFVNELMGPDDALVIEAYTNLKALTGLDPAATLKNNFNDIQVINEFMEFYRQRSIDGL